MNSTQFKNYQFKQFCADIGYDPTKLKYILENIDDYYNEWFEKKKDKKTGGFKKYKDGTEKKRVIRHHSKN